MFQNFRGVEIKLTKEFNCLNFQSFQKKLDMSLSVINDQFQNEVDTLYDSKLNSFSSINFNVRSNLH